MDDLISRQAAIRWVKTECNPYGKPTIDFESGKKVIEHLENMPSAQPDLSGYSDRLWNNAYERGKRDAQAGWILCNDRTPTEDGEYLATFTDENGNWVSTAEWNTTLGGRWQCVFSPDDGYCDAANVIAWMPMPEPYKGS